MIVLETLKQECQATDKEKHYEIFRQCIIEPTLEGKKRPPRSKLAKDFDLTERQVSNVLLTAKRAYQRLLREEIRVYASTDEEVTLEIQELYRSIGNL